MFTNGRFKSVFMVTLMISVCAWTLTFVFSALAGETPNGTLKRAEKVLNPNNRSVTETKYAEVEGVETIEIESSSNDIQVIAGDQDHVKVEFQGMTEVQDPLIVETQGSTMRIHLRKRDKDTMQWNLSFSDDDSPPMYGLRITLPRAFQKTLAVSSASGGIRLDDLKLATVNVATASGDIDFKRTEVTAAANLKSVSGDIEADSIRGAVNARAVSGDIELDNCLGGELRAETVSGDLEMSRFDGTASARSVSGDIEVRPASAEGWKFQIRSTSGDITNKLSDTANATKFINLSSTSGDIRVVR